jgi:hypothetical protein
MLRSPRAASCWHRRTKIEKSETEDTQVFTVAQRSPLVIAVACVEAALIVAVTDASYSRAIDTLGNLRRDAPAITNLRAARVDLFDADLVFAPQLLAQTAAA